MRRLVSIFVGLSLAMALVVSAWAASSVVRVTHNDEYGNILTDSRGMTLYKFDPDRPNESVCYDECAAAWPPLLVKSGQPVAGPGVTTRLGLTTRKDGSKQVTANGMPLYYFAGDKKPGDDNGQGIKNIWWVVSASGQPIKSEDHTPSGAPGTGAGGTAVPHDYGLLAVYGFLALAFGVFGFLTVRWIKA